MGERPRFSIVATGRDLAGHLAEFMASVEAQTFPLERAQIIAVDDGSTDGSADRLRGWAARRPELVTVLTQAPDGPAAARNLGLGQALGEWVGFAGLGDVLDPAYLAEVDAFLTAHPETELVACHRSSIDAAKDGAVRFLTRQFAAGNQLRDLSEHPSYFCENAVGAFLRGEQVGPGRVEFDPGVRPVFDGGHFAARYLLSRPRPLVGFVATAGHGYRERAEGSATESGGLADPGHFTTAPRAYLALLRAGRGTGDRAPAWLQALVLFNLGHLFAWEDKQSLAFTAAQGAVADEFHELLGAITGELDPEVVRTFAARSFAPAWRDFLLHAYRAEPWHQPKVVLGRRDSRQKLVRLEYRFTGERPAEEFVVRGEPVAPVHEKIRALPYFDRTLLWQRIVWLPAGRLTVSLNGRQTAVARPKRARFATSPRGGLRLRDRVLLAVARSRPVRARFKAAWALVDRLHDADDSAEHLFRYLRASHRTTNAWFVIEKGTPDHRRLRSDGVRRVIPYGSMRWKLLMLNCEHVVSSHADPAIVNPPVLRAFSAVPRWRFTFLNHGVIKDDLSAWLNPKDIEIFVTSTTGEYESVCGDGTRYIYTRKEAQLTGMPRFDRLLEAGDRFPPARRDLILVAPTWRSWLAPEQVPGSQQRIVAPGFAESEFARQWRAVLASEELAELAQRTGLEVASLLHPNLQAVRDQWDLPAHVRVLGFVGNDVRDLFARSRVVITDYSSMAFNAAYIERPVVYFQFDHEAMFGGAHVGRRGYFDYERDGFGPVTFEADAAIRAVCDIVERGPEAAPEYRRRIDEAFPNRDGQCCERVYEAIRASVRKGPRS